MKKQNLDKIEKDLHRQTVRRERKKKTKMKVNGAGVKGLGRLVGRHASIKN